MINPQELRIDNTIKAPFGFASELMQVQVREIAHHVLNPNDKKYYSFIHYEFLGKRHFALCEKLEPIPLDGHWLKRLGFTLMPESEYTLDTYQNDKLQIWNKKGDFSELYLNILHTRIYFVHQLQNLYFALSGKELTATVTP